MKIVTSACVASSGKYEEMEDFRFELVHCLAYNQKIRWMGQLISYINHGVYVNLLQYGLIILVICLQRFVLQLFSWELSFLDQRKKSSTVCFLLFVPLFSRYI